MGIPNNHKLPPTPQANHHYYDNGQVLQLQYLDGQGAQGRVQERLRAGGVPCVRWYPPGQNWHQVPAVRQDCVVEVGSTGSRVDPARPQPADRTQTPKLLYTEKQREKRSWSVVTCPL